MMKILLASYVLHGEFSFNSAQSYQHRKGEFYIKYDQLVVYFSKILLIFFFQKCSVWEALLRNRCGHAFVSTNTCLHVQMFIKAGSLCYSLCLDFRKVIKH